MCLKVISRSTFDLQPVLETLVESVARLCDTEMAFILRRDGEVFRAGAAVGYSREYMEYLQSHPLGVNRGSVTGRVALEGRIVQIADVTTDAEYTLTQTTILTGQRTALGVPLFREGQVIGVFVLARRRVEPFTDRQIELATTFADQAAIAINNVGLFNETQEALEQQTATAEVLKVISRSAFDLNLATSTILEAAAKLCRAPLATLHLRDGEVCRLVTQFGLPEAFERQARENPNPGSLPLALAPARARGRRRAFLGRLERSRLPLQDDSQIGRLSRNRGDPLDAGRRTGGNFQPRPSRARTLYAEPDQARPDFRRSGGDRDRERAAVQRGEGQDRRPCEGAAATTRCAEGISPRSAAAANRHRRGAEGHQPIGVRSAGGVRHADFVRRRPLRGVQRRHLRSGRRGVSLPRQRGRGRHSGARQISRGPSGDAGAGVDRRPGALVRKGGSHS